MFGFGKKEENEEKKDNINWGVVESRLGNSFGLADLDRILKLYAPDLTGAILNTEKGVSIVGNNQQKIGDWLNQKLDEQHEELIREIHDLKRQNVESERKNRELQEKYDELVQRMAGYIEKENGKGR